MTGIKFNVGDTVVYRGSNHHAKDRVGRIIEAKNAIRVGGFHHGDQDEPDYTVKFLKFGFFPFVLDANEKELEGIEF